MNLATIVYLPGFLTLTLLKSLNVNVLSVTSTTCPSTASTTTSNWFNTVLFDAFFAGSNLSVEVKNGTNVPEDDATVKYTATVACTALDLNADYDGAMEYSATFKVKGDFVKVK